jgi:hypothetical protein
MRTELLSLLAMLFIISCGEEEALPEDILPKQKMEAVLWDIILAGEYLSASIFVQDSALNKDSAKLKIYGRVFQVHQVTKSEFEKSYSYYRDHPELMRVIVDSLSKRQGVSSQPWHADSIRRRLQVPVKGQ